jgi:DNA-binding NtrC family response regulator
MKRILVAEDESSLALALGEDLRAEGYDVEVVGDGDTAAKRATSEHWDLIVLDVICRARTVSKCAARCGAPEWPCPSCFSPPGRMRPRR